MAQHAAEQGTSWASVPSACLDISCWHNGAAPELHDTAGRALSTCSTYHLDNGFIAQKIAAVWRLACRELHALKNITLHKILQSSMLDVLPCPESGGKHQRHCAQVDSISVGFALIIFLWLGFREPHRLAFHAPVAYAAIMAVMGSLLFIPRLSLTWCARRRCLALGEHRAMACLVTSALVCFVTTHLGCLQSLQAPCHLTKLLKLLKKCMSGDLQECSLPQCAAWHADSGP